MKGLLKRLKNIEDKTDKQLNENRDSQLGIKSIGYTIKEELSKEARNMLEKLNNQEKLINYKKFYFKGGNNLDYDFSEYRSLKELFKTIQNRNIRIKKAERIQDEFNGVHGALEKYKQKKEPYIEKRRKLLINSKKLYDGREIIIDAFKNKMFPMASTGFEDDEEPPSDEDKEKKKDNRLLTIEEEEEPKKRNQRNKFLNKLLN